MTYQAESNPLRVGGPAPGPLGPDRVADPANVASLSSLASLATKAWVAGGVLWLAAGIVHADSAVRFRTAAVVWIVSDLLILAGLLMLRRLALPGSSAIAQGSLVLAIVGRLAFLTGEVVSLPSLADDNAFLPLGSLGTVIGLIGYGVIVFRRCRPAGASRFGFLAAGLYPFVAMFPLAAATGDPPVLSIAAWGIVFALAGATIPALSRSSA